MKKIIRPFENLPLQIVAKSFRPDLCLHKTAFIIYIINLNFDRDFSLKHVDVKCPFSPFYVFYKIEKNAQLLLSYKGLPQSKTKKLFNYLIYILCTLAGTWNDRFYLKINRFCPIYSGSIPMHFW